MPLWEWSQIIHLSDVYVYDSYIYDVHDIYAYDVHVYYAYEYDVYVYDVYGVYVYDEYGVYVPVFLFFAKAWVLEIQLSFLYAKKALYHWCAP